MRRTGLVLGWLAAAALLAACGPDEPAASGDAPAEDEPARETLRVYTTVTQDTVDAVVEAFEADQAADVEVFRAPTGEFNARVAAERREGEIQADVFWLTDPLSMEQFAADGLLRQWTPEGADVISEDYRTDTFWATRLLNLVIVARADLATRPADWWDLADPAYADGVALPDPGFAGSAFGALGYFALEDDFGFAYFESLAENGVVQVDAPGEVVAGVAEGRFAAGMTLDRVVRDAVEDGSPVELVWPEPGAIAVFSPIGVLERSDVAAAEAFVEFSLSLEAQQAIAETGWQPVHPDVEWAHEDGPLLTPDWSAAFARQDELLEEYRSIIGG